MTNPAAIVFDTTYILPAFGVEVNMSSTFNDELIMAWEQGIPEHSIYLPSVCLIEASYKLIREFKHSGDLNILDRYSVALPTFLQSSNITIVHPQMDPVATDVAMKLRGAGHEDMMDCWIAGCAASLNGILLTEDSILVEKMGTLPATSGIQCWTWTKLQRFQS
jgi:hypothetical protein